jgi:sodium/proline symporter
MSTASAMLLSAATSLTEDFYHPFIRPQAGQRELINIARLAVVLVASAAVLIAITTDKSILKIVAYAWGGLGASFGPVLLFSLYWKRMTRYGAIVGMLAGTATVVIWELLHAKTAYPIFTLYGIVPGFLLSSIAIVLVSKMGAEPSQIVYDQFDQARQLVRKF